jgi:hypothetical protein
MFESAIYEPFAAPSSNQNLSLIVAVSRSDFKSGEPLFRSEGRN